MHENTPDMAKKVMTMFDLKHTTQCNIYRWTTKQMTNKTVISVCMDINSYNWNPCANTKKWKWQQKCEKSTFMQTENIRVGSYMLVSYKSQKYSHHAVTFTLEVHYL